MIHPEAGLSGHLNTLQSASRRKEGMKGVGEYLHTMPLLSPWVSLPDSGTRFWRRLSFQ